MHARAVGHMFAQVVDADVHQFDRIQRGPPQFRRPGCMRSLAVEGEVDPGIGQRTGLVHAGEGRWMPGDRRVHIIEEPLAHHISLGRATFLGRAAVVANAPLDAILSHPVLDGGCGQKRGRPKQVVPTPMAIAAFFKRPVLGNTGFLAQIRQRIKLAQDRDNGAVIACFADHGGGDAGGVFSNPKALRFQHTLVLGHGFVLGIKCLGRVENAIRQRDEVFAVAVDVFPDRVSVLQGYLQCCGLNCFDMFQKAGGFAARAPSL